MIKSIKILALPLWGNYGGMLQAYALSRSIAALGFCPCTSQLPASPSGETALIFWKVAWSKLKYLIRWIQITFTPIKIEPPCVYRGLERIAALFKARHLNCEELILPDCSFDGRNVYVVGSDQVWRCLFTRKRGPVSRFFLDFASQTERCHSISYAASFGTDEWEGTPEETRRCGELLRQFKAVSVREFSGVRICKEVFGVDAVQMPDPTLLATLEDYERVIIFEPVI